MSTEMNQGSIAGAMAVAALDRAEALDAATVKLQAQVRKELGEAQAVLRQESTVLQAAFRQEAAETRAILRQETEALNALRQEAASSIAALQALQPGIERSSGVGVKNALAAGSEKLRADLAEQVVDSAKELKAAAREARGMVRRLTPLWGVIIAIGGLLLGVLLMYFVMGSWQRKIEEKIDRLQQAPPIAVQPAVVASPVPAGVKSVNPKPQGNRNAIPKPKAHQAPHVPPPDEQP